MDLHTCAHCHQAKPLEEFSRSRHRRTGRHPYCKICQNEQSRTSYYRHREKRLARQEATTKAKRQAKDLVFLAKRRALQQKRRQAKPGEDAAIAQGYRQRYPHRVKVSKQACWENRTAEQRVRDKRRSIVISARRRAQKAAAPRNDLTASQWEVVLHAFAYRCAYCHKRKPLTQDHVTPFARGGSHTLWNVVPACKSCNSKKGTRGPLISVQPLLL